MSIIYEALKKVEKRKNPLDLDESKEAQAPIKEDIEIKPQTNKKNVLLVSVMFAVTLILFFLFNYIMNSTQKANASSSSARKESKAYNIGNILGGSKKNNSGYNLEGIVFDKTNPFAIINGKVVKNYDRLDYFMVVNITEKAVEMTNINDRSRLILTLP